YRKKHYVAEKTIVVVAGDVTEKFVLDEVKKHFKTIPQGKRVGKLPVRPKQKAPGIVVDKKKTNQTHMLLGFHAYDAKDKRLPALAVLSSILGGGMSGRLWRKVRHELGACYYVYSAIEENTDHGVLAIATGINASRVEEVLKTIISEVKDLRENKVLDDELKKAKEYYIGHLYMSLETTHKLTEFYGIGEVSSGKLQTPFEIEKQIRAVTAADVLKVAKDIFKDENLNLAIVGNVTNTREVKKVLTFKSWRKKTGN
ncbi:MAG: insulinase family protein, partial [Candidatus Zambryskibacteria bacterium]|nr:insulinase family protein [Candidatus Zambryskibacteria bacterium]